MLIKTLLFNYGPAWMVNRALYSAKLRLLRTFPKTEKYFEKPRYAERLEIFDFDCKAIASFLSRLPQSEKNRLIATADDACRGIITGFSAVKLDYGQPINWQLNPLTGKSCELKDKWYRIPDFDNERGDIKVIWEISRFSHFFTLCRAYMLTGDRKYYTAFSEQLDSWLKKNPYSFGANYKCGQECSLRMINALAAYAVFSYYGETTEEDRDNMLELVSRCYMKVLSNFFYAYRCIKNNHTISELCGMIIGAWCCCDEDTLNKAYVKLDGVLKKQFTSDGGYTQYSFNYQRFALQLTECLFKIAPVTGQSLSAEARRRIKASAALLYQCQQDGGVLPNYGSNDGALIFPVTSCDYRDYRPVINTAYALAGTHALYPEGMYSEELLWFGTGEYPTERMGMRSCAFKQAGLFTLRSGGDFAMICLNDYRSRPGHMDQLHIDIWRDGKCILCDSGTGSYADEQCAKLADTEGHNVAYIDSRDQMSRHGPFLIYDWSRRGSFTAKPTRFKGTVRTAKHYSHTREVILSENGYVINDHLVGDTGHCDFLFHTPCDVRIEDNCAVLSMNGRVVCYIRSQGDISVTPCKRSLYYMCTEDISCVRIRRLTPSNSERNKTEIIFA